MTALSEDLDQFKWSQRDKEGNALDGYYPMGGVVSLVVGSPGTSALSRCESIIKESTNYALDKDIDGLIFQYGPRAGSCEFRYNLANWLNEQYQDPNAPVHMDDLIASTGATNGLYYAASLLFKSGTPVFIEDPTYFIAIDILRRDLGMNIVPVPMTSEGTDTELLDKLLTEYRKKHPDIVLTKERPFWSMLYIIPTHNNPTGRCISPEKAKRLVEIARKHDILIFCDDVYNMLHYKEGPPPRRLLSYDIKTDPDYKGHVLSNGTFSKILSPGIRLGWQEAPPRIVEILNNSGNMWSGGCVNHYISTVVGGAIKLGLLTKHLNFVRSKLSENLHAVSDILRQHKEYIKFQQPEGGYFMWLELPDSVNTTKLKDFVQKYKITFHPGEMSSPEKKRRQNCIRISISYYEKEELCRAVTTLCQAIEEYIKAN